MIVIISVQAFAGIGGKGVGLMNPAHQFDVLSVTGGAIFGSSGLGTVLSRLLILMVLSSAAASTQTTILPTARTTLSMAAYGALPESFAKINPRYLTPTVSTVVMGAISIALYIPLNYISGGNPIADAVTAIGLYIAFYYGLTAFACVWHYRATLTSSSRNLWMRGILPGLGGLIMYAAGVLQPAERLGRVQQLHHLDGAGPALAGRRHLHHRRAGRAGRPPRLHLHAGHGPGLLPPGNAHPDQSGARLQPGAVTGLRWPAAARRAAARARETSRSLAGIAGFALITGSLGLT